AQGCEVLLGRMMKGSGESWVRWRRSRNVGNGVLQGKIVGIMDLMRRSE
nr:hypothetical protein [Tanacetum cinerariifolium]